MGNRISFLKAIFLIGFLLNLGLCHGQKKKGIEYSGFFDTYYFRGPINITAAGGLTSVNGDICKLFDCNSWYASAGASYQVWPRTYFGGDISYLTFQGSRDKYINYSFNSKGLQLDLFGRFLLLDRTVTRHGQLRDKPYRIRPYIQTGVGIYHTLGTQVSTLAPVSDSTLLTDITTMGFQPLIINIPVGLGFQIWLSHRLSLMPEVFYRFNFSDRLDGIELKTDKSKMDGYLTFGLKVQYTPQAPRMKTKKKTLTPPDEYTGPKGTDYPKKRREETRPANNEPLPGEEPQDGQAPADGQEQPQDGQQQGGDQQLNKDGQKEGGEEPKKDADGWGW